LVGFVVRLYRFYQERVPVYGWNGVVTS